MARVAVLGLDEFGAHLARALHDRGDEVVAVDEDGRRLEPLRGRCSRCLVADCTDRRQLADIGLEGCDAVVLSLAGRLSASLLATLLLEEMGVRRVLVRALSADHARILERLGAAEVVYPERDAAERLARLLAGGDSGRDPLATAATGAPVPSGGTPSPARASRPLSW